MTINKIICGLPLRTQATESLMSVWCKRVLARSTATAHGTWAVVGGAIRDCLLSEAYQLKLPFAWPDVDFAVSDDSFHEISNLSRGAHSVHINNFGGLKVRDEALGILDVWHVDINAIDIRHEEAWAKYLDRLDFSLNAIAFIWPQKRVLIHPKWQEDFSKRRIRRLNPDHLPRTLAPIRALALAAKMSDITNNVFYLDRTNANDFRWLTHVASEEDVEKSLAYLCNKLLSHRWPISVFHRMARELSRKPPGPVFSTAFHHLSAELTDKLSLRRSAKPH